MRESPGLKLIAGAVLLIAVLLVIKGHLLPIVPELSVQLIRDLKVPDLLKIFEATIFVVIIAGFVLQELLRVLKEWLRPEHSSENESARWKDLSYVLVAAFGSAVMYGGVVRLFGW